MRKIILAAVLTTLSFATATASENDNNVSPKLEVEMAFDAKEPSAFCKLIKLGNYDAVKALIKSGENVNKKSTGLTPLMFAARHNKAKIAQLLIESGAKLHYKCDRLKFTALKYSEMSKATDAYEVISKAVKDKKKKINSMNLFCNCHLDLNLNGIFLC